jgi:hypothetical protein
MVTLDQAMAAVKADEGTVSAAQAAVTQLSQVQQTLTQAQTQYISDLNALIAAAQAAIQANAPNPSAPNPSGSTS